MSNDSISQKVMRLHNELRFWWHDLCRIAVALYDPRDDMLSTFVSSSDGESPLVHYRARLADVPSLKALAEQRQSRVIVDLEALRSPPSAHTQRLLQAGFRSSYSVPMYSPNGQLTGFLFFDANRAGYFDPSLTRHLDIYAELLSALIQAEIAPVQTLSGAVFTAKRFTDLRDEETGAHLARVAHYARLIATNLADKHALDDEYIEFLYQFAPLHDIGKIAIPDRILLSPARLDAAQRRIMQTHVTRGLAIIDEMIGNFGLRNLDHVETLRDIVLRHHEQWDGGGYPDGLSGNDIPLAARIVSLADSFDALLSTRPYKPAWTHAKVKQHLRLQRGRKFDPDCVDALLQDETVLLAIREKYLDSATRH